MQTGAAISGTVHAALIAIAMFGLDWFRDAEDKPLNVTEIEFVDGTEFEAALSTAPFVPTDDPDELRPPGAGEASPEKVEQPEDAAQTAEAQALAETREPEPKPEPPEISFTPKVNVPTEAPAPSIAEIPSPDPLDRESIEPESPPSTEPVAPLASMAAPVPEARPTPPPEPEPEPEKPEELAETTVPDAAAEEPAKPDPEPVEETSPETVAEAQPEAPESAAPREARLPVARPADLAAAARAARESERARAAEETPTEAPSEDASSKPAEPTETANANPGATVRRGPKLNRGEINALRLGIKKHYVYTGDRSDRALQVTVRVDLDREGKIQGKPKVLRGTGGTAAAQRALGQAGSRALIKAERAGEFKRLPQDKYGRWKRLNFVFTIDQLQVSG